MANLTLTGPQDGTSIKTLARVFKALPYVSPTRGQIWPRGKGRQA